MFELVSWNFHIATCSEKTWSSGCKRKYVSDESTLTSKLIAKKEMITAGVKVWGAIENFQAVSRLFSSAYPSDVTFSVLFLFFVFHSW